MTVNYKFNICGKYSIFVGNIQYLWEIVNICGKETERGRPVVTVRHSATEHKADSMTNFMKKIEIEIKIVKTS